MSANKEDVLRQFCDVTGADEARSKFFLESSNWQLEVALSSFYEHGGNIEEAPAHPNAAAAPLVAPPLSDSDMESPPGSPLNVRAQKKDKKKQPTNQRFATLNTLQQESSSDEEEVRKRVAGKLRKFYSDQPSCSRRKAIDELLLDPEKCISKNQEKSQVAINTESNGQVEENVEALKRTIESLKRENNELKREIARLKETDESSQGQAFYAGGSERSGQQIIGPGKGRKDIVSEMFKSVRERGAVVFEDEPTTASRGRGAFSGVGHRLGQGSEDPAPAAPPSPNNAHTQSEVRSVRLRLYREGFTVDDGALRPYSDPQNAQFLSCIRNGEIPPELSGNGEVRVSLEDRRMEECPRSNSKTSAFTGKGQMLGSPTPPTVGATAPVAAAASDRAANQRAAQEAVKLDDAQPTTTLQFRLADGTRLTGRFNHSHTVGDLLQYVSRAEPAYQLLRFVLLTTFPSNELNDPTLTLENGKLLNTTLLQRLK